MANAKRKFALWRVSAVLALIFISGPDEILFAAPTTQQYLNVMTICGLGSHITLDNNTKEKVQVMLEEGISQGKAVNDIAPKIADLVLAGKQPELYDKYVKCMREMMSQGATPEGRQEALLQNLTENTPVTKIDEAYGQPSRITNSRGIRTDEYTGEGHYLYLVRNSKQLLAFGLSVDSAQAMKKQIPLLGLSEYNPATGETVNHSKLGEITIGWLSSHCDNFAAVLINPRYGYFSTSKCYFGNPGHYKNFYFGFNGEDVVEPCRSTSLYDWPERMLLANVKCKGVQKMHPEFVLVPVVDFDDEMAELLANKVQGYRYSGAAPNLVRDW